MNQNNAERILGMFEDEGVLFLKSEDNIELSKGRKAEPLGMKKQWGGKDYIKTVTGWKPVGKESGAAKAAHDFVHGESKLSERAQELYDKTMDVYNKTPLKQKWYVDRLNDILAEGSEFDEDHKTAAKKMLKDISKINDEVVRESKKENGVINDSFEWKKEKFGHALYHHGENTGIGAKKESDKEFVINDYKKSPNYSIINNTKKDKKEGSANLSIDGIDFKYKITDKGFYQIIESKTGQSIPSVTAYSLPEAKKQAKDYIENTLGLDKFKNLVANYKSPA